MKQLILISILFCPNLVIAQINPESLSKQKKSTIEINMQTGIENLLKRNQQINILNEGIKGFCVQIYLGTSRENAQRTKYKFMKLYPEIKSISYERISPNWKVRVGKFRTKLEAKKLQSIILSEYPNSFITGIIVPIGEFD